MKDMNTITIIALVLIFLGGLGGILLVIGQGINSSGDKQEIIENTKSKNEELKVRIDQLTQERGGLRVSLEARDQRIQQQTEKIEDLNNKLLEKADYIQKYLSGGEGFPYVDFLILNSKPGETQKFLLITKNDFELPIYNIHIEGFDYDRLASKKFKFSLNGENKDAISAEDFSESLVFTYDSELLRSGGGEGSKTEYEVKNSKYYITINTKSIVVVQKVVMHIYEGRMYVAYQIVALKGGILKEHFYDAQINESGKEFIRGKLNEIPNAETSYIRKK
jgi:hypothetical protein